MGNTFDTMCARFSTNWFVVDHRTPLAKEFPPIQLKLSSQIKGIDTVPWDDMDMTATRFGAMVRRARTDSSEEAPAYDDSQELPADDDYNERDVREIPDANTFDNQPPFYDDKVESDEATNLVNKYVFEVIYNAIMQDQPPKKNLRNRTGKQISILHRCCSEKCSKQDMINFCR